MMALAIPSVRHLRETPPPVPAETRLEIVTPRADDPASFALSPDGRQIVFAASGDGGSRLWLRSLAGTEGATEPFWSPDGRAIGFFAGNGLKRIDLGTGGGGNSRSLAQVRSDGGGTWNADNIIVFGSRVTGLMRVSASGGPARAVTPLGPQQSGHAARPFLPDGLRPGIFSIGHRR